MATDDKSADADVLADTFSSNRDRGADSAAPDPKTEAVHDEAPPQEEAPKTEAKDDGSLRDDRGRFAARVPLSELTSERDKRQSAEKARDEEARLRTQLEDRLKFYDTQMQDLQRRVYAVQQPQSQVQQPEMPDPITDPNGWAQYQQAQIQNMVMTERANMSEISARRAFGDEIVDKATQAALQANLGGQFMRMRDPYGAVIDWFKRQQVLSEIGPDPEKYKTSLRDQIRHEVLAELQKNGTASPQAAQRFPGTLADKTASGPSVAMPVSDEAVMGEVFGHARKRR